MRAPGRERQRQMAETTKDRVFQKFPRDWNLVCASGNGQNEAGKEIRSDHQRLPHCVKELRLHPEGK